MIETLPSIKRAPIGSYTFPLDSQQAQVGDEVNIVGFPLGLDMSLTTGVLSNTDAQVGQSRLQRLLQVDAPASQGNSGGPVLSSDGELLGVLQSGIDGYEGLNFAVEISSVSRLVDKWLNSSDVLEMSCDRLPSSSAAPSTTEAEAAASETVAGASSTTTSSPSSATSGSGSSGSQTSSSCEPTELELVVMASSVDFDHRFDGNVYINLEPHASLWYDLTRNGSALRDGCINRYSHADLPAEYEQMISPSWSLESLLVNVPGTDCTNRGYGKKCGTSVCESRICRVNQMRAHIVNSWNSSSLFLLNSSTVPSKVMPKPCSSTAKPHL